MSKILIDAKASRDVVALCERSEVITTSVTDNCNMTRSIRQRNGSQDSQSPLVVVASSQASVHPDEDSNSQPSDCELFDEEAIVSLPDAVESSTEKETQREDGALLSTYRHKFIKRIPRTDTHHRQKWLVHDVVVKDEVVLHKIATNYQSLNLGTVGEFGLRSTCQRRSFQHIGRGLVTETQIEMNRDFFREVILMRCVRKCSHILKCHGFVLDSQRNLYISTEQFGEESLARFRERTLNQVLPVSQVRVIGQQLLQALGYMHSIRICHNEISASNVVVSFQPAAPSRACPDQEGRLHVKVGNFRLARDFSTWVECPREFECYKCRPVSRISSRCAQNRVHAMKCHPAYDMLCFGYLVFRCLRGTTPWLKECSCDMYYNKHRKRLARLRTGNFATKCDFENSAENRPLLRSRNEHSQLTQRTAKTLNKMRKSILNKHSYETKDSKKSWKSFTRSFTECLALLLSDCEEERPRANEMNNPNFQYWDLFSTDVNANNAWTRKPLRENIVATCVFSDTRR